MDGGETPANGRKVSRKAFLAGAAGGGIAVAASGVLPRAAGAQTGEGCGVVLRTPDGSFDSVSGFPFRSNYTTVEPCGLRMHYLDEGPRNGPVVLLAHGNPAWSYMYRGWILPLVKRGYRVVAPDLIGFG